MACWTHNGELICDDATLDEIRLTLPGCVNARPTFGLTIKPAGARPGNFRASALKVRRR